MTNKQVSTNTNFPISILSLCHSNTNVKRGMGAWYDDCLLTVRPNGCPGTFLRPTTLTVSTGMSPFSSGLSASAMSLLPSASAAFSSIPEPRSSQIAPIWS